MLCGSWRGRGRGVGAGGVAGVGDEADDDEGVLEGEKAAGSRFQIRSPCPCTACLATTEARLVPVGELLLLPTPICTQTHTTEMLKDTKEIDCACYCTASTGAG